MGRGGITAFLRPQTGRIVGSEQIRKVEPAVVVELAITGAVPAGWEGGSVSDCFLRLELRPRWGGAVGMGMQAIQDRVLRGTGILVPTPSVRQITPLAKLHNLHNCR